MNSLNRFQRSTQNDFVECFFTLFLAAAELHRVTGKEASNKL